MGRMPARKKSATQKANSGSSRIAENKHKTVQDELVKQPTLKPVKPSYPLILQCKESKMYYEEIVLEYSGTIIYRNIDNRAAAELANWMVVFDKCSIEMTLRPFIEEENCNNKQMQIKENPACKMAGLAQRNINNLRQALGQTPKARLDQLLKASTIKSQDVLSGQQQESNTKGYDFESQAGKHKV